MFTGLHVKYPLLLSDFNGTWMLKYQWKPNCSMWTDGQTDTKKTVVDFRTFVKSPKIFWGENQT